MSRDIIQEDAVIRPSPYDTATAHVDARDVHRALRETEDRFRSIVESALDAIVMIDRDNRITEFNPAAEAIFGLRREDVIGRDLGETLIPPAMRAAHRRGLARYVCSDTEPRQGARMELTALRADGCEFPIEVTVSRMAGDPPRFTAFIRDLTERRAVESEALRLAQEQKRAQEELRESERRLNAELEERVRERTAQLEAANRELEAFSYSLAHDIRSPLTSIDGFSSVLMEYEPVMDEIAKHYLKRIRTGVQQMSELTDALLSLANVSRMSLRQEQVDLAEAARVVLSHLREREHRPDVQVQIPEHLWARGDPPLLGQVIANLVGNAWKFSARKPSTVVRVGSVEGDGEGEPIYYVADEGAGFDMQHASRLFGAFQRLHAFSEFEGTGIGLALVHKIVARHGGRIWAQAKPGDGATFYFTLG